MIFSAKRTTCQGRQAVVVVPLVVDYEQLDKVLVLRVRVVRAMFMIGRCLLHFSLHLSSSTIEHVVGWYEEILKQEGRIKLMLPPPLSISLLFLLEDGEEKDKISTYLIIIIFQSLLLLIIIIVLIIVNIISVLHLRLYFPLIFLLLS